MSSVQTIQHTLTTSFVEAMIDGVMAMVTLVLMLVYSWKLALVTLLAVALYLGIRAIAYRPMRDRTEQQLVAAAKQQTHLLESLRGMQSLKVAGEESVRRSTYENLLNDTVNQDVKLARMSLGFNTASQLVFGLERIAVIWIGARLALDNVFSVGMLVAYLAYKDQFAMRVSGLIDKWIEFRMLRLHGERLADIVLTPPEKAARTTARAATRRAKHRGGRAIVSLRRRRAVGGQGLLFLRLHRGIGGHHWWVWLRQDNAGETLAGFTHAQRGSRSGSAGTICTNSARALCAR